MVEVVLRRRLARITRTRMVFVWLETTRMEAGEQHVPLFEVGVQGVARSKLKSYY